MSSVWCCSLNSVSSENNIHCASTWTQSILRLWSSSLVTRTQQLWRVCLMTFLSFVTQWEGHLNIWFRGGLGHVEDTLHVS